MIGTRLAGGSVGGRCAVPNEPVQRLLDTLATLGVGYARFDHPAVFTCAEAELAVLADAGGAHTKNLFLRDQKGRRHWLLVTDCAKQVDLRGLAPLLGADRLSLASPDRLARLLGLTPGSVTVFGLLNDPGHEVELVIDRSVSEAPAWRCHPLTNTATLVVSRGDIDRFLAATGHRPAIVVVPERIA